VVLPQGFQVRNAREEDVAELDALFVALDRAEGVDPSYRAEDMRSAWRRADFDLVTDTFVLHDSGGEIAAYGHVETRPPTDVVAMGWVDPAHFGRGLGTSLIDLLENRARRLAASSSHPFERVVNIVTEWDTAAAALLTDAGYALVRHFWSMSVELDGDLEEPKPIAGVTFRGFEAADARTAHAVLVDAFKDHWGADFPDFDDWAAETMERNNYDPSLWWVAEEGGRMVGALAADSAADTGWVIDVGVLREWRNRGIGRALLLRALIGFKSRGLARAALGVDSESLTGATRLYESLGMKRYRQINFYAKDLVTGGT
jgi:ribosomal protein S18 acetylase RimI-like enzyme